MPHRTGVRLETEPIAWPDIDGAVGTASMRVRQRARFYRLRRNPLTVVGVVCVCSLLFVSVLGPYLVPYPGDATGYIHVTSRLQAPSWNHIFGTDEVGRDNFSRVIIGARLSLLIAFVVVVVSVAFGTLWGTIAGYKAGPVGEVIMRITDIVMTIPSLTLALAVDAALGPSILHTAIAIAVARWPIYTRLVHAQMLKLREEPYVLAAIGMGASATRVVGRHLLPNALAPIVVQASLDVGFAILTTAALGFIGLGVRPPTPEWGAMVSAGRNTFPGWWWNATFSGLAIFLSVLAFNFLGDGLRDVLDPEGDR